ncbi:MFS transporter [Algibacillus agarilyticus]|uniref:MFS transporter n=1 Tax=Algibacillus agarilyticus TaxID=2234133 RepID=UPI000DD0B9F9|nr:MFS transporter [Algibacillus agarilyticus]
MDKYTRAAITYSCIVTLGGIIFGLDTALISGTLRFIVSEFALDDLQLGTVVSAPALGVLAALIITGPICEIIGRKKTLIIIAFLYTISSLFSVLAPTYEALVAARLLGGMAFTSLSIAAMYIGEIAPAKQRGKLVSINQIMIVLGVATAYTYNYVLIDALQNDAEFVTQYAVVGNEWRWMLAGELLPAIIWLCLLFFIPESPRWLVTQNKLKRAKLILAKLMPPEKIEPEFASIIKGLKRASHQDTHILSQLKNMRSPTVRLAVVVGVIFAIVQPLTGVNPILYYAPMIFEQAGGSTNSAFANSISLGIVSFIVTFITIIYVDKIGRRPLVNIGLIASILSLLLCVWAFYNATYHLTQSDINTLILAHPHLNQITLAPLIDVTFHSDIQFKQTLQNVLGLEQYKTLNNAFITAAININSTLVLVGIIGVIGAFHLSIGPVMWVVFSEIVPTSIRGVAIPIFAFITALVSFVMQKFFPIMLNTIGADQVFLTYALASLIGLYFLNRFLPETKGRTLEEIESFVRHSKP